MLKPTSLEEFLAIYEQKKKKLLALFPSNADPQKTYEKIIELGKTLPTPSQEICIESNLVEGCQSVAYLSSDLKEDGTVSYKVHSNALISSGLAALLLFIYNDEKPEFILVHPPLFIQELGLHKHLSPGRSNGLASMYTRMKKEALNLIKK